MGRGGGKNRALAEFVHAKATENPGAAGFLAARTLGDVSRTIIGHPQSGLLVTMPPDNPCEVARRHNVMVVEWANGAYAELHTSEEPEAARGGEYNWGAADEIGTWKRKVDFEGNTTWVNLGFALRGGVHPQMIATSTPRPIALIRELIADAADPTLDVVMSRGSMHDNADNLPKSFIDGQMRRFAGTRLERQEINGELLTDVEDAILTQDLLDGTRVELDELPAMQRIVVGVDPAAKSKQSSDRTGINVSGLGVDGHLYSLANRSCKMSPDGWGRRVVEAYHEFSELAPNGTPLVVPEDNMGGEMVENTIRHIDRNVRVQSKTSTISKHKRFATICPFWERKEAHMVGKQPELESQLVQFTPSGYEGDDSPDDADAHVFAASELMLRGQSTWAQMAEANG